MDHTDADTDVTGQDFDERYIKDRPKPRPKKKKHRTPK